MKQPGYILPSNVGLVQVVCVWGGGVHGISIQISCGRVQLGSRRLQSLHLKRNPQQFNYWMVWLLQSLNHTDSHRMSFA